MAVSPEFPLYFGLKWSKRNSCGCTLWSRPY